MPDKPITKDTIVRRSDDLLVSNVDSETILLSLEQNNFYGMNEVGTRIWDLLESPQSVSALCERLDDEFNVSVDKCQEEVIKFIKSLTADKLVIMEDDAS